MQKLNILDRTFGIEFEFADVEKDKVVLPDGFSWNKEETFRNTDCSPVSGTSKFGGEINTPPLHLCKNDIEALRFMFGEVIANGAKCTYVTSIHVHIGIADLELEDLKKLFSLSYYTSRYIKQFSDLDEWNEESWYVPSPTVEYYQNAMDADTMEKFFNVFANSMRKGYIRHMVNVASYFKRKTVEFRSFNETTDFNEVIGCIAFAYRYVNYALTHTEEDFKRISDYDTFMRELKIHIGVPKKHAPMVFVGDMKNYSECFISKNNPLTSKMLKVLLDNTGSDLSVVNPDMYAAELNLYDKVNLTIYNNDELNDVIYRICTDGLVFHYSEDYDYIERYNDGSPEMMLVCLFLFHRLHKYSVDNDYAKKELEAYQDKIDESVDKLKITAKGMIDMFSKCKYVLGTVNDAVDHKGNVFYQIGNSPKMRSTLALLKKNSTYDGKFEQKTTLYYNLVEDLPVDVNFMMLSRNGYLAMNKLAQSGRTIFYSNKNSENAKIVESLKNFESYAVMCPNDDLVVDDYSKLSISEVDPSQFYQVQEVFIKKVHKITPPRFSFLVFYDGFCIGGFGFEYPKDQDYDLWLLSDFNTNNSIDRISKLILLCIQSNEVKRTIQRKMRTAVDNLYTKVYSQNHVSMKYRGIFKKNKEKSKPGSLIYTSDFGVAGDIKAIVEQFKIILSRKGNC